MSDEEIFYQISVKILLKYVGEQLSDLDEALLHFGLLRTVSDPIQVSEFYENEEGFRYRYIFMFSPNFLASNIAFGGIDPNVKWKFSIPNFFYSKDFYDYSPQPEKIMDLISNGVIEIISGQYPLSDSQDLLNYGLSS